MFPHEIAFPTYLKTFSTKTKNYVRQDQIIQLY